MTILCETHFNDASANAVAVAAELARRSSQRLWLTSVLPRFGKEKAVDAALHLEAGTLREQGVEVETTVLHGAVDRAVTQLSKEVGAELLVVGDTSHPRGAVTTIDRLASEAAVPLLVVHNKNPFEAWAKTGRPLRVLLALDQSSSAEHAREWISRMARYGPLDVVGAHVCASGNEGRCAQKLKAVLEGLPSNVTSRTQLEVGHGRIGRRVLALAARERADVVVLGSAALKKGLLGRQRSVGHEVLGQAPMSVAVVAEPTPALFATQRRGALSLGAVVAIIAASLIGTGVLLEAYREGAFSRFSPGTCQLLCQGP